MNNAYIKGRGAQLNPNNKFEKLGLSYDAIEGIDDWVRPAKHTQYVQQQAQSLVNKVTSPDVGMAYSMNPYQGCEHGCIYCYARNAYEYYGGSAGIDFESKIIVKTNAPTLLKQFLLHPQWVCTPIGLSGNTDCYQPAEKKFHLTQQLLQVCNHFNQPVSIITKNAGILRDTELLQQMAQKQIVSVLISITSLNEEVRRVMEPRTATAQQRLRTIHTLSNAGIPVGVMLGPMIPGLNEHEMHNIMQAAANNGASFSAYTFIRLNGTVKLLFHDWLHKNFPNKANKVWHLIEKAHNGQVNDSRFGIRMRGEGPIAQLVHEQYQKYQRKYQLHLGRHPLNCSLFTTGLPQQGSLW